MIDAVLFGARGRMGRMVTETLASSTRVHLAAGVEQPNHPDLGKTLDGLPILDRLEDLPQVQVWLDFSLPAPAMEHARAAAAQGMPLVIAATGFSNEQTTLIKQYAEQCPLLLAPNLSMGIGALNRMVAQAAKLLRDSFDVTIVETHHATKRDAPSGTAKRIAESIQAASDVNPTILSIRAGGIIGEHEIRFTGADEELVITHRAWSRRAFASGVERALEFIISQPFGWYGLNDLFPDA